MPSANLKVPDGAQIHQTWGLPRGMQKGKLRLGAPGTLWTVTTIVLADNFVLDETAITKKKAKRGIQGRTTRANSQWVLGCWEMNLATREGTGRALLMTVPNRTAETMEVLIRRHVALNSKVWTDGYPSYKWMRHTPDFDWAYVVHKDEFTSGEVSSNGVEGLFGRTKKHFRFVGNLSFA